MLEHFLTDTADYADYVLPATTQLEHVDVHKSYGHLYMLANNPAIAPLGEALPNSEIFRRLAATMGFTSRASRETDDEMAAQAFKREGATAGFDWQRPEAERLAAPRRLPTRTRRLPKAGFRRRPEVRVLLGAGRAARPGPAAGLHRRRTKRPDGDAAGAIVIRWRSSRRRRAIF